MKRILLLALLLTPSVAFADNAQTFTNETTLLERITDDAGHVIIELAPGESIALDATAGPYIVIYVHTQAGG